MAEIQDVVELLKISKEIYNFLSSKMLEVAKIGYNVDLLSSRSAFAKSMMEISNAINELNQTSKISPDMLDIVNRAQTIAKEAIQKEVDTNTFNLIESKIENIPKDRNQDSKFARAGFPDIDLDFPKDMVSHIKKADLNVTQKKYLKAHYKNIFDKKTGITKDRNQNNFKITVLEKFLEEEGFSKYPNRKIGYYTFEQFAKIIKKLGLKSDCVKNNNQRTIKMLKSLNTGLVPINEKSKSETDLDIKIGKFLIKTQYLTHVSAYEDISESCDAGGNWNKYPILDKNDKQDSYIVIRNLDKVSK